jgi:hypothetical protein
MELTGKCKIDFEKWLRPSINSDYRFGQALTANFEVLPPSMRYGVYVDFFDSVGIYIEIDHYTYDAWTAEIFNPEPSFQSIMRETRNESQTEAIEKANEIYNR